MNACNREAEPRFPAAACARSVRGFAIATAKCTGKGGDDVDDDRRASRYKYSASDLAVYRGNDCGTLTPAQRGRRRPRRLTAVPPEETDQRVRVGGRRTGEHQSLALLIFPHVNTTRAIEYAISIAANARAAPEQPGDWFPRTIETEIMDGER